MNNRISYISTNEDAFKDLVNGNQLVGSKPVLKNSSIDFKGKNNIFFCEDNVLLVNSKLVFNGNNSVIYLSSSKYEYKLNLTINNNQVFHMGKDNYINGVMNIILSEQQHIFIGADCLFSTGIWMRNADPHLIYDSQTMQRINPTRSIFLGDHIWLGQSAMILKGTKIGSGSIIGAMSLVPGRTITSNTSWGGNPAVLLKTNVFWDGSCVHEWTDEKTELNQIYENDRYIFSNEQHDSILFEEIERELYELKKAKDKLDYLIILNRNDTKNRFAI